MTFKEARKILKDNPRILNIFAEAVSNNTSAEELSKTLTDAGLNVETVEALIMEYQRKLGLNIASTSVDEDALKKVTGGGSGVNCEYSDDCDAELKDPKLWSDRCNFSHNCDELFC